MYEFVDRPIEELDYPSRFYLWAMRRWVLALQSRSCPCAALERPFNKWKMTKALPAFMISMTHLNQGANE